MLFFRFDEAPLSLLRGRGLLGEYGPMNGPFFFDWQFSPQDRQLAMILAWERIVAGLPRLT